LLVVARNFPRTLHDLAQHIQVLDFVELVRRFLYDQLPRRSDDTRTSSDVSLDECPLPTSKFSVFNSAVATFYAPSDQSGIRGMKRERIRCVSTWRNQGERRDCALVVEDDTRPGMKGMSAVRVKLFFSFSYGQKTYPCALVEWFKNYGASPDKETGMWRVRPHMVGSGRSSQRLVTVVHLDSFLRGVHLLPVFGNRFLPTDFHFSYSLDVFEAFYVNKYSDHRAHEIIY